MKTRIHNLKNNLEAIISNVINEDDCVLVNFKRDNVIIISESKYQRMLNVVNYIQRIKDGKKEDISSMTSYNPKEKW